MKHLTEAVTLKPDFVQGYKTLAHVYTQFKRPHTAKKSLSLHDL